MQQTAAHSSSSNSRRRSTSPSPLSSKSKPLSEPASPAYSVSGSKKRDRDEATPNPDISVSKRRYQCSIPEISTFLGKNGGLVSLAGAEKLYAVMQQDHNNKSSSRKLGDVVSRRSSLAAVIYATERHECLAKLVQLGGLALLNDWLQDAHKGKLADAGAGTEAAKALEELLMGLLHALEKLPVDLEALKSCNAGKSVRNLRNSSTGKVHRKAKKLVEIWRKRVDAEMKQQQQHTQNYNNQSQEFKGKLDLSSCCNNKKTENLSSSREPECLVKSGSAANSSFGRNIINSSAIAKTGSTMLVQDERSSNSTHNHSSSSSQANQKNTTHSQMSNKSGTTAKGSAKNDGSSKAKIPLKPVGASAAKAPVDPLLSPSLSRRSEKKRTVSGELESGKADAAAAVAGGGGSNGQDKDKDKDRIILRLPSNNNSSSNSCCRNLPRKQPCSVSTAIAVSSERKKQRLYSSSGDHGGGKSNQYKFSESQAQAKGNSSQEEDDCHKMECQSSESHLSFSYTDNCNKAVPSRYPVAGMGSSCASDGISLLAYIAADENFRLQSSPAADAGISAPSAALKLVSDSENSPISSVTDLAEPESEPEAKPLPSSDLPTAAECERVCNEATKKNPVAAAAAEDLESQKNRCSEDEKPAAAAAETQAAPENGAAPVEKDVDVTEVEKAIDAESEQVRADSESGKLELDLNQRIGALEPELEPEMKENGADTRRCGDGDGAGAAAAARVCHIPISPVARHAAMDMDMAYILQSASGNNDGTSCSWRGRAPTSAFRPAEPRNKAPAPVAKVPESAPPRPCFDFDLNVPQQEEQEQEPEPVSCSQSHLDLNRHADAGHQKKTPIKHDFDLNAADAESSELATATDLWVPSATTRSGVASPGFQVVSGSSAPFPAAILGVAAAAASPLFHVDVTANQRNADSSGLATMLSSSPFISSGGAPTAPNFPYFGFLSASCSSSSSSLMEAAASSVYNSQFVVAVNGRSPYPYVVETGCLDLNSGPGLDLNFCPADRRHQHPYLSDQKNVVLGSWDFSKPESSGFQMKQPDAGWDVYTNSISSSKCR